jgi:ABC-type Mn2+/Zn2+ transport system permease subunit
MDVLNLVREDFFYLSLAQIILFLVVGVPIGNLLVHKNLGLFSDSLSHSLIPGIAGAIYFFGLRSRSISIGAVVWGVVVSILFSFLGGLSAKKRDSFLVVISLLGISAGLIVNQSLQLKIDFSHLLFGSPLLTSWDDLISSAIFSALLGIVIAFNWKKLILFSIDPEFSRIRYGEFKMNFLFTLITSLLVIMGFNVFGVLLTTGLLILPTLLFELKSVSISRQLPFSILMTMLVSVLAFILSYEVNLTFSATLIFSLSFLTLGRFIVRSPT